MNNFAIPNSKELVLQKITIWWLLLLSAYLFISSQECANSSAVSFIVVAGCQANFHSLFLIMAWFAFFQPETSSFITVQGSVVDGFAKENWVGGTVLMARYQKELLRLGWAVTRRYLLLEEKIPSCTEQLSRRDWYFYNMLEVPETKRKIVSSQCMLFVSSVCSRGRGFRAGPKSLVWAHGCSLPERSFFLACCRSFLPGPQFYCITIL